MDPITVEFLGVILRTLLTYVGGFLVAHHVINDADRERYVAHFATEIVLSLPAIGALAWGLWVKLRSRKKLLVALSSDVKMSENEAAAIVKSGCVTPTVSTPKNTIPGVPA